MLFLGPTRPITLKGISINSAIFPKYADRTNMKLDLYQQAAYAISDRVMWTNNTCLTLRAVTAREPRPTLTLTRNNITRLHSD